MFLLRSVLQEVRTLVKCDGVTFYKIEGAELAPLAYDGILPEAQALGAGFPLFLLGENAGLLQAQIPVIIGDVAGAEPAARAFRKAMIGWQASTGVYRMRCWMGVPVAVDGRLVGVLGLDDRVPECFSCAQAEHVQAYVTQIAVNIENAILLAETQRRADETHALLTVQQAITSRLDLDAVLQLIAEEARRLVQARRAMVFLLDGEDLVLKVMSGDPNPVIGPGYRMPAQASLTGVAMQTRQPYRGLEPLVDPRADNYISEHLGTLSFIIVPLTLKDRPIGAIVATDKLAGMFGAGDERMLALLAPAAVIGLENARLYSQADRLARLQERQHLAMALHDTAAQLIFGLELISKQALEDSSLAGDCTLRRQLEAILRMAERSGYELRSAIFTLRHEDAGEVTSHMHNLRSLLQNQIDEFRRYTEIATTLVMPPALPSLPADVNAVIYRVLREALTNIYKHARASTVLVSLYCSDTVIVLTVQDDGIGIADANLIDGDSALFHFGIAAMREMVQQVRGELLITNNDDGGTVVKVRLPITLEAEL